MTNAGDNPGYSAEVQMRLIVQGAAYALRQLSPLACTLRDPADLPAGIATVELLIDGYAQQWDVELQGTTSPSTTIAFVQ